LGHIFKRKREWYLEIWKEKEEHEGGKNGRYKSLEVRIFSQVQLSEKISVWFLGRVRVGGWYKKGLVKLELDRLHP
jgi:hypothetical protein